MEKKASPAIEVFYHGKNVIKKYNCQNYPETNLNKRFFREIRAYEYFNSLNIDFVPRLISHDESACSLVIENIKGITLQDFIEQGNTNVHAVIDGLIKVDSYLYRNKINYMHSSIKDILFAREENRIFIIDFEYTFLNEYFQQILYDCMFGSRMGRIKNRIGRDKFLNSLRERRNEFESFYYRKAKNVLLSRLGMIKEKD